MSRNRSGPRDPEDLAMNLANGLAAVSLLLGAGVALAGEGDRPRVDERLLPSGLTENQKTALANYLAAVKKPDRFIPESARVVGAGSISLDPNPVPGAEIKEYLTTIVPYRPTAKDKPPEKVEIYWYRPNPKKGSPGVTIRRVVDLATGESTGEPEVLFDYPTPLSREELAEAIKLARDKNDKVGELFRDAERGDVVVSPLVTSIKVAGAPYGTPGDRVVNLQFLKKSTMARANTIVNLTRETVRDPGTP
jgi:hypothetical protein